MRDSMKSKRTNRAEGDEEEEDEDEGKGPAVATTAADSSALAMVRIQAFFSGRAYQRCVSSAWIENCHYWCNRMEASHDAALNGTHPHVFFYGVDWNSTTPSALARVFRTKRRRKALDCVFCARVKLLFETFCRNRVIDLGVWTHRPCVRAIVRALGHAGKREEQGHGRPRRGDGLGR